MSFTHNFLRDEIEAKFGVECPLNITVESEKDLTDDLVEDALLNYIEYHMASEEKISAADAFWKRFHIPVGEAREKQKSSLEYQQWQLATDRLLRCKKAFVVMKHSHGVSLHQMLQEKAA